MSIPRIAVNVMVKNASDSIVNALTSAAGFVDEIVVFDTGSTDGTQDIVQRYLKGLPSHLSSVYREVPWIDDFSAIRNQMLEATSADWVLALDSDEVLSVSGGTLRELAQSGYKAFFIEKRSYVKSRNFEGFSPLKREYPEQEKGYVGYISEPNYLFFEKNDLVRYERCVHETIEHSLTRAKILSVRVNQVVIHNHGRHDMSVKGPWYKSLIRKLAEQSPNDGLAWCYLGTIEKDEGNLEQALESLERSISLIPHYAAPLLMKAQCLVQLGRVSEAEKILTGLSTTHAHEETVWLELINAASRGPDGARAVINHVTRAEALKSDSPAVYEAAAAALTAMKKQVKAEMYRKRARELKRQQDRNS